MPADTAAEIIRLREVINAHDQRYYVEASPVISDIQYDRLLAQLRELEISHPQHVTLDSPTQRIGDAPVDHLITVRHQVPMLSIDNTYSVDELRQYRLRTAKLLPEESIAWVVELKVDGVAVSLTYEEGLLVRALTRGDGRSGDDITHNVRTVRDVPLQLKGSAFPSLLEVRGEIYMTNADLAWLNEQQQCKGETLYANTRNVAAGTIRLLDPRVCAERRLRMFSHGVGRVTGLPAASHVEQMRKLNQLGLRTTPNMDSFISFDEAIDYCEELIGRLHELDFEVDGLVLKVDCLDQRERLGHTSRSPRWMIAYKYEKYEAITILQAIRVQVGKTGAVTPVADLKPVKLAETTVSRASLHNTDEIVRKDIRVGDVVVVEKAGKIIPHIVRVEKHRRTRGIRKFSFPTRCPACQTRLVQDNAGVVIRCPNLACLAQLRERILFYASRGAMDIEGLGTKLVEQLVSQGWVGGYSDLYHLTLGSLMDLKRMGRKSSENLLLSIEASKGRGLARLLSGLSIRHVGQRVATILAKRFGSIDRLRQAEVEVLSETNEIGPIIAQSVFDFLHSDFGRSTIDGLCAAGVRMFVAETPVEGSSQVLVGKTLVVTGRLLKYTRKDIEARVLAHGGRPSSSVSQKTDYLVAGENAGNKLEKARKLGVTVLSETEFDALTEG